MKKETIDMKLLNIFVVTYDTLNLTRSSEYLEIPKSSVSKSIAKLERYLNVKLFNRTSRAVTPTEEGDLLYTRAMILLSDAEHLVADVSSLTSNVSGQLNIAAPPALGRFLSRNLLPQYMRQWPKVSISVKLSYDFEDLFREGIDIAFRIGRNIDQSLIEKPLGASNRVLVATPEYLATHAPIKSPIDLERHQSLQMFSNKSDWILVKNNSTRRVSLPVAFQCSDMETLKNMLFSGVGIAQLPWLIIKDDIEAGTLVPILPQWLSPDLPISLVYRHGHNKPAKLAAFLDLIEQHQSLFDFRFQQT